MLTPHHWHFFRAGGCRLVGQTIRDGKFRLLSQ